MNTNRFLTDILNSCKKAREEEVKKMTPQTTAKEKKAIKEEFDEDDCSLPGIIVNKPHKKKVIEYFTDRIAKLTEEAMD
jgi:tRNA pseudouridine-54 N-methylase